MGGVNFRGDIPRCACTAVAPNYEGACEFCGDVTTEGPFKAVNVEPRLQPSRFYMFAHRQCFGLFLLHSEDCVAKQLQDTPHDKKLKRALLLYSNAIEKLPPLRQPIPQTAGI